MYAIIFKLLFTYIFLSAFAGIVADTYGVSDNVLAWLFAPPLLLLVGSLVAFLVAIIWSL